MGQILYVDGFNFYYGVTDFWRKCTDGRLTGLGWCDFRALVERNFPNVSDLQVKYFTAPVIENVELRDHRPGEHNRYFLWRRAVETIPGLKVVEGFYKPDGKAPGAGLAQNREEKQTDVNLAVEVLLDSSGDAGSRPTHAFLLCGDYDQMPTIFALQERVSPPVEVTVLLPPAQRAEDWMETFSRTRSRLWTGRSRDKTIHISDLGRPVEVVVLSESMLANSLLRYKLNDQKGSFVCPFEWKLPAAYLAEHCCRGEWLPE